MVEGEGLISILKIMGGQCEISMLQEVCFAHVTLASFASIWPSWILLHASAEFFYHIRTLNYRFSLYSAEVAPFVLSLKCVEPFTFSFDTI